MGLDQRHEQLNKDIKGDGGMTGLTEDAERFRRWQICSPEQARIVAEFEEQCILKSNDHGEFHHHEDSRSFQVKFKKNVEDLIAEFVALGNPFNQTGSNELIQLGTQNVMDEDSVSNLRQIEKIGIDQWNAFKKDRLINKEVEFKAPIKKNKLTIFTPVAVKGSSSKSKMEITDLKNQIRLFSQMYISTQTGGGDMELFFSHETLSYPPSLAQSGYMRSGEKSQLAKCLESTTVEDDPVIDLVNVSAAILEGSVLVNLVKPKKNQTFKLYCTEMVMPQVKKAIFAYQLTRIDIVFDRYINNSLKSETRSKRGKGLRRKVNTTSIAPTNWREFLRLDQNKTELFEFLSREIIGYSQQESNGLVVCAAYEEDCIASGQINDMDGLTPCNHEEADTRVFIHVANLVLNGHFKLLIKTVDTDVMILAISAFATLQNKGLCELWLEFGTGNNKRLVPIHMICARIGTEKSMSLPFFHAVTGCDQVSFLSGITKNAAWKLWNVFDEVTGIFRILSNKPTEVDVQNATSLLERFVILLYERTSSMTEVNAARRDLFCKGRPMDRIPPTKAALLKHIMRASYIAGHVWGSMLDGIQNLPDPTNWGWKLDESGKYRIDWSDLPEAALGIRDLVKCGCNPDKGCHGRCKCISTGLPCTELCLCKGECERV